MGMLRQNRNNVPITSNIIRIIQRNYSVKETPKLQIQIVKPKVQPTNDAVNTSNMVINNYKEWMAKRYNITRDMWLNETNDLINWASHSGYYMCTLKTERFQLNKNTYIKNDILNYIERMHYNNLVQEVRELYEKEGYIVKTIPSDKYYAIDYIKSDIGFTDRYLDINFTWGPYDYYPRHNSYESPIRFNLY